MKSTRLVDILPTTTSTTPDPCDIGALLTRARIAAGLTAAQLAERTGIAPSNISRALRSPDTRPATARRILRAIGATLEVGQGKSTDG